MKLASLRRCAGVAEAEFEMQAVRKGGGDKLSFKLSLLCAIVRHMNLGLAVAWQFVLRFVKALVAIAGIPTVFFFFAFFLGIDQAETWYNETLSLVKTFGPLTFIILLFAIGIHTTYEIVKKDRLIYRERFYKVDPTAHLERAHLVFFDLYLEGRKWKGGSPTDRIKWDKKVQEQLQKYCNEGANSVYMVNTKRFGPGSDSLPIPEDKYDWALNWLWDRLEDKFDGFFKS